MRQPLRPSQAQLKAWRGLKKRGARQEQGLFLAEGEHLCQEALGEGIAQALLYDEGRASQYQALLSQDVPCYALSAKDYAALCDTRTPQGISALCALPSAKEIGALGPRVVALEAVQDPGNVGGILRGMDAANFTGLLIDEQCADPFSPKALRASMGAAFRLPICRVSHLPDGLRQLREYAILAGSLTGSPFYQRPAIQGPLCLLIGNEGAGLSQQVEAMATLRLRLPMPGRAESLNAAVAASIMMYDFVRTGESPEAE